MRRRNKRPRARKRAGDDATSLLSERILWTERPARRLISLQSYHITSFKAARNLPTIHIEFILLLNTMRAIES